MAILATYGVSQAKINKQKKEEAYFRLFIT